MIPYGRQSIDASDVRAVVEALESEWLTTGPKVSEFEEVFSNFVESKYAVAVSSGTAALHCGMFALGIRPGDEVIVPPLTFVATSNCVIYQGGTPVFADIDPATLLISPDEVEKRITPRTKGIIAVDYAGQPCDYDRLREIAKRHNLFLVADACHSLGGTYKGRPVGGLADLNAFSFHPVKHITTGEGGMVTTNDPDLAQRMQVFRNHGITTDHRQRQEQGSWFYEMVDLGFNYRITDFQCALGITQLGKLKEFIHRRKTIAAFYTSAIGEIQAVQPLAVNDDISHAYHLYVVQLDLDELRAGRTEVFAALREQGIGVNIHYIPVHLHPFYRERFGTYPGLCPAAERAYERILSIPIFPRMTQSDVDHVMTALENVLRGLRR